MARILFGSYMVRYPLGGMMSYVLQYLLGFHRLGHEVYLVEKAGYPDACFDPIRGVMGDDPTYGAGVVDRLLDRFGLEGRWCFVDAGGAYHGLSREEAAELFRTADLFVDMGTHGAWLEEAEAVPLRVLIDGEPGFNQMKLEMRRRSGEPVPDYDRFFTNGMNLGTPASSAPTVGVEWEHVFHPVLTGLFPVGRPPRDAPITTVMNWTSHDPVVFEGRTYGQKDVEFEKFLSLPEKVRVPLEIAVAGDVPSPRLERAGWRLRDAHETTLSYDAFVRYLASSRGEFSVCKNVFVETRSGWFSDRSAAYLASGRPVVLQETGFSAHLPTGTGLFAVRDVDEAADAIGRIEADPERHCRAAREIAATYLEARVVLRRFLEKLGVPSGRAGVA